MDSQYAPLNLTAAVALASTVWMLFARFRVTAESNWPLFYYLGVTLFSYAFPGYLEPAWVYAGVVAALFLRFEFMAGAFLKFVRVIEYVVLLYLLYAFAMTLTI
jgi:hypothetical protein